MLSGLGSLPLICQAAGFSLTLTPAVADIWRVNLWVGVLLFLCLSNGEDYVHFAFTSYPLPICEIEIFLWRSLRRLPDPEA